MKAAILAFIAVVGLTNAATWEDEIDIVDLANMDLKAQFESWGTAFGREYQNEAERYERFGIWLEGMKTIAKYNSEGLTFKLRANQFTDLTNDEFRLQVHGKSGSCFKKNDKRLLSNMEKAFRESGKQRNQANPASVDWEAAGNVTPVKNQGQCGSCWAFSTTGSLECRGSIASGNAPISLSEQELVDCSGSYGNEGCNGGLMDDAFKYVKAEGGLCTEANYPYKGRDGTCNKNCGTRYDDISGYTDVTRDNEGDLETASVAGCVSVAIEADQTAFQYYSSGVLTGRCGTRLDHGVLVVGYGTDGNQEYWKVKNSWGTSWGMDGYVLICKDCNENGSAGECGINSEPSYPDMS